jgi:hypothetical protein
VFEVTGPLGLGLAPIVRCALTSAAGHHSADPPGPAAPQALPAPCIGGAQGRSQCLRMHDCLEEEVTLMRQVDLASPPLLQPAAYLRNRLARGAPLSRVRAGAHGATTKPPVRGRAPATLHP